MRESNVDLRVQVGRLELRNPIMTASGTVQSAREAADHLDLRALGAVVSKSLSSTPWQGHSKPNIAKITSDSLLNAIGLTNPGVEQWSDTVLPDLREASVTVVASIWGRSLEDFSTAAKTLINERDIVAIELNLSCPNLDDPRDLISHDPSATADVVSAVRSVIGEELPLWAKLSPNAVDIVEISEAAASAGASAVTLVNTMSGMLIDVQTQRPVLANGYGGVSGRLLFPIAVRAVHQVHQALPDLPIIGVGGITAGTDVIQMLMAGASAVQIGTAHFSDRSASNRILREVERWCEAQSVAPAQLTGVVRSRFIDEYS